MPADDRGIDDPVDDDTGRDSDPDVPSPAAASAGNASGANDGGNDPGSYPTQKRRRVTRACDECRRKKIKCDGRQPCTHCTVYSYDCTYDQPSHRRRNPAPIFLEQMERKLKRAEAIVKLSFPDMSLDDPRFDTLIEQGSLPPLGDMSLVQPKTEPDDSHDFSPKGGPQEPKAGRTTGETGEQDLESMVRSKGTLDLDEKGHYTYFGASSGLNFLKRIGEDLGEAYNGKPVINRGRKPEHSGSRLISDIMMRWQSPERSHRQEARDSPSEHEQHDIEELPSRKVARRLCHYALEDAAAIISPVHQPSFYKSFDRLYDRNSDIYEDQDHRFLPLLYTVMALGCLFAKDGESELEMHGYASATDQGYKYFWHARQLVDITDCRDLTTLQAIVFMILFLQCSAKLATCYAYIGVAHRSAIRMGMHRSFRDHFSPIDLEVRKRLFWAIRKMDIFVSALLGLPLTLSEEDIDQDYPSEVDDEFITAEGIKPMPPGRTAKVAAANADFKLTAIMTKLLRAVYPVKSVKSLDKDPSKAYRISYATIKDIENDLQKWENDLPEPFKPGGKQGDTSDKFIRIRHLLRMAYAFVQMLLYRPFLHYISPRCHSPAVNARSYACAEACLVVSRNIIHITAEMKRNGLLMGSYWFIHYTAFFAVLSLVFYALENSNISQEMMRDAVEGRETMAALARRSMAADRCTATLTVLFEHFAEARNREQAKAKASAGGKPSKKRDAPDELPYQAPHNVDPSKIPNKAFPVRSSNSTMPAPKTQFDQSTFAFLPNGHSPALYGTSSSTSTPSSGMSTDTRYSNSGASAPRPANSSMNFPQTRQPFQQQAQPQQDNSTFMENMDHLPSMNVSAMMFPSSDPMAYPNQPMLALEQAGGYPHPKVGMQDQQRYQQHMSDQGMGNGMPNHDGGIDAALFGNPTSILSSQNEQADFDNLMMSSGEHQAHMLPSQPIMPGSSTFPGLNFDDIWGTEHWG